MFDQLSQKRERAHPEVMYAIWQMHISCSLTYTQRGILMAPQGRIKCRHDEETASLKKNVLEENDISCFLMKREQI